jgi:hypothetical protein
MRGNRLGAALMGGDTGDRNERPSAVGIRGLRDSLSADGFPIPERFKEQLGRFDTNNDAKLSTKEIDAMPEVVRNRVRQAIRLRVDNNGE